LASLGSLHETVDSDISVDQCQEVGVRLTEPEAWEALEAAHTGILTTLRRDGSPVTLPVWFVVLDRSICLRSPRRTKKVARVRNDPRASFLVESGARWAELRAAHLTGLIEAVEDGTTVDAIGALLDDKYAAYRTATTAMPASAAEQYATFAYLRLVPEPRLLTWDNRRLQIEGR
jgi:nitroimidazol reductase NimA-like FMN-containing flavoprotein (pyridoxamine 5'-phosphate oxidase superfamily)